VHKRIFLHEPHRPPCAGPLVVPRLCHKTSTSRVPQDVANSEQETINFKGAREESSLKEVSPRTFTEVDTSGISFVGLANSLVKAMLMEGNDNQVNVICHQTPRQELDAVSPALLSKQGEIGCTIFV